MAIKAINEWDTNPNDNDFSPGEGGFPELQLRSSLNDSLRIHLAELRKYYNDPEWIKVRIAGPDAADIGTFARISATLFSITLSGVDLTGYFGDGRIINIIDGAGAGVDLIAQVAVSGATYSGGALTTVNIKAPVTMGVTASDVFSHSNSIMRSVGLTDNVDQFYVPLTPDSQGINDAVALADAAGGGTVYLLAQTYAINNAGGPIDLVTKGRVIIRGSGPETVLRQDNGELMNSLVTLGHPTEENQLLDMRLDANRTNNLTGNGVCVAFSGVRRVRISRVAFADCEKGIDIASAGTGFLSISDCTFETFRAYGIGSTSSTDVHVGQISASRFHNGGVTRANPAAIKVAGKWAITSNRFASVGHASLVSRGIWLWPKSAGNTGGQVCTVIGNRVEGGNAANGTAIDVGGDSNAVNSNSVVCPTAGIGIHLNSSAAGQIEEWNSVVGNSISGGNPIVANIRTSHCAIEGNSCAPGAGLVGIDDDGTQNLLLGNAVDGGSTGIRVSANASGCVVRGNTTSLPTASGCEIAAGATGTLVQGNMLNCSGNGVLVAATAVSTVIRDNEFAGAPLNNINNSSPSSTATGNERTTYEYRYSDPDTDGYTGSIEVPILDIEGVDWPGDLPPGRYRISYSVEGGGSGVGTNLRFHSGPNGDITDTQIYESPNIPANTTIVIGELLEQSLVFSVTDGTAKFTAGVIGSGVGNNFIVNYIWIVRVGDE